MQYLISSLWKVPDQETVTIMNDFYGYHSSKPVWKAFLQSQRNFLQRHRKSKTGKSHPYFWAAFFCQGNPFATFKPTKLSLKQKFFNAIKEGDTHFVESSIGKVGVNVTDKDGISGLIIISTK